MGYTVYGAHGSGSSIVEATFAELGIAYAFERIDAANHAQREAAYAAINPHLKLPTVLTPDGETLTESVAILLTLLERHPEPQLLPATGTPERAQALRWLMFASSGLYPIVEIIDYPDRFSGDDAATPRVRELALETWRSRWLTVEHGLDDGPFLLGDRFSVTDIYLAALSRWDLSPEFQAERLPKLSRLANAVKQRPALGEIWSRNFPKG